MAEQEEFICDVCKKTFVKGWSDEAAKEEAEHVFGILDDDEPKSLLCTYCYMRFMGWYNARDLGIHLN